MSEHEAANAGVCPACGANVGGGTGCKPSGDADNIHSDAGAGQEHGDGPDENIKWFHYIPLSEWEEWEKIGWRISRVGHSPHDDYSVMGEWRGEGPAVRPMVAQIGATSSPSSSSAPGRGTHQPLPTSK